MFTYKKPKLMSLKSDSLIELFGPGITQYEEYGSLDIGAARRAELSGQRNQIVICKIIPEKQNELVKLG